MSTATDSPQRSGTAPPRAIDRSLAVLSALAGFGTLMVSSCCALPLVLALAGIGTGWLGDLEAFADYRPAILGIAGVALVAAWAAFIRRQAALVCAADGSCATMHRRWVTRGMLGLATAMFTLGSVFPSVENDVLDALMRLQ